MDTKSLAASVAAGLTILILGFLFYAVLLMDFLAANSPMPEAWKEQPDFVFLVVGELLTGAAVVYAVSVLGGFRDFMGGLKAGATLGLLLGLGLGLTYYATSNMLNLTAALTDVVVTVIRLGLGAGVGALVMGKMSGASGGGS